ncbi:TPR-like protein [Mycena polygramma]|nr:TPR-like protein [Mycena polygramma]
MFKAGDPWNPYDPASLDLPPTPAEFMRRMQAGASDFAALFNDPEKMAEIERMQLEAAAEREITGETEDEQILREKREWAEADAKSAKLKDEGNEAFKKGDYKTAYVNYTVCMIQSGHEPIYPLNRAAASLKLRMYETAVEDATTALERGDFNRGKALCRRAQARCFLGEWDKADEDYTAAMAVSNDRNIADGFEELKRLRSLPADDQTAWISAQKNLTSADVFGDGEAKRRVEEILGYTLP